VCVHDVLTMIGGSSTEGTSENGMIIRNLLNRGDREESRADPLHGRLSPPFSAQRGPQYSISLSHLSDPHTGTYCIYIFFYDDGRNICVLLVTTPPT